MKNTVTVGLLFSIVSLVSAQAPQIMSYQAVVRNANNTLVINSNVGVRISIIQGSVTGTVVYFESQTALTNSNGLITLEIGSGSMFGSINWADGPFFIKTEIDPNGGTNYTITGASQLLSVPYSLHAKTAEQIVGQITETDPVFSNSAAVEITADDISNWNNKSNFSGDYNHLSNKPNLSAYLTTETDGDVNNEIQMFTVSWLGDTLHLSSSNYVIIPGISLKNDPNKNWKAGDIWFNRNDSIPFKTVKIGNQVWMAENLRTMRYNDGTEITEVTDNSVWGSIVAGAFCWYNNSNTFESPYGKLYNFHAVNTNKLCPTGWHVPTHAEWTTLTTFLGGETVAGGKLKETGLVHWQTQNFGATNEAKFTAMPGGFRNNSGGFAGINQMGSWWSSTVSPSDANRALGREMTGGNMHAAGISGDKKNGFSVRCLKD
jgi:uncharacterized protein (TIGR02145 family)